MCIRVADHVVTATNPVGDGAVSLPVRPWSRPARSNTRSSFRCALLHVRPFIMVRAALSLNGARAKFHGETCHVAQWECVS
jgi:hypothetical protein